MADVRVIQNVVLSDPTTPSQIAGVDASGHLQVDIAASSATVTVDTELAAAGALADNTANPTVTSVGAFPHWYDGSTWDRAPGTAADGLLVNLGSNNDVTVTGQVTIGDGTDAVDVLAAGADDVVNTTNQLATAAMLYGFDGAAWDRIYTVADGAAVAAGTTGFLVLGSDGSNYQAVTTDASGHLQVDVLTGAGNNAPVSPELKYDTSASVAAGASDNHDAGEVGGSSVKLEKVVMGASVALKGEIQHVTDGAGTTLAVVFSPAGGTAEWTPPHPDYADITFTANAGYDGFRLVRTNLDASEAADVYSTMFYDEYA